jgi:hypothetical protein
MEVHLDPRSQQLVEQELSAGRAHSPEAVVARALEALAERDEPHWDEAERQQAVQNMLEFAGKHHLTLGEGLRIKDLIHEGHKY